MASCFSLAYFSGASHHPTTYLQQASSLYYSIFVMLCYVKSEIVQIVSANSRQESGVKPGLAWQDLVPQQGCYITEQRVSL